MNAAMLWTIACSKFVIMLGVAWGVEDVLGHVGPDLEDALRTEGGKPGD